MLNFVSPEKILNNPKLLIDIFVESAAQNAPLSSEAKRLVKDFGHLIDERFRSDPEVVRQFERILIRSSRAFEVLNQMLHTGFLVHFIPDFKGVVNRIQFDQYHLYPVARHLLFTIKILKSFDTDAPAPNDPLAINLFQGVEEEKNDRLGGAFARYRQGRPRPAAIQSGAPFRRKKFSWKREPRPWMRKRSPFWSSITC